MSALDIAELIDPPGAQLTIRQEFGDAFADAYEALIASVQRLDPTVTRVYLHTCMETNTLQGVYFHRWVRQ